MLPATGTRQSSSCGYRLLALLGAQWRKAVIWTVLLLTVFGNVVANVPAQAHAAINKGAPNHPNPTAGSQSILHKPPVSVPTGPTNLPKTPQSIKHTAPMPMKAGSIDLQPGKTAQFIGSDGRLQFDIPANAITAADLKAAGGKASLLVSQVAPASGSTAGGSGHVSFGTYLIQVVDAQGKLLPQGLRQAITATYHYGKKESAFNFDHAFVLMNGKLPQGTTLAPLPDGVTDPTKVQGTFSKQPTIHDSKVHTIAIHPLISTPASSLSFNTDSPVSVFGTPDPFNVDLNAGALTAGFPIEVPQGPGGLTPPINLGYSSESTAEQHSPQGAAPWVGEGWSLSLGSISWAEHNVLSNGPTPNWESSWQLSDPYGTGSELIGPDINISTYYDDTPNNYCATGNASSQPCPILWHTANESHAKIYSYVGPLNINMPTHPVCWRVYLTNGIMEEFGCTLDSLQYYYSPGNGFFITGWNLDLITDPNGNQIHLTYQADTQSTVFAGVTYNYPRDTQLATVEYDSPTCHDKNVMCTGANWAPLVRVNFAAAHTPSRLTNTPTGCNTGSNLRCDDPLDLKSGGGQPAPQNQTTFALNDVQVQVRSTGTGAWNLLRDYQLSYEQSGPAIITDPVTGTNLSTAGMFDLTRITEVGTDGATALPTRQYGYSTFNEYYEDDTFTPKPTTNCGPSDGSMSWNTGNGSGCLLWNRSYANNNRYLTSASNGLGLAQTFSFATGRNNTHGVPGGGSNTADPLYCNSHQTGYPCNEADDQNWSHVVLTQQTGATIRPTSAGNTPITETTGYSYLLSYPLVAQECSDCVAGMYWGNQNDGDYLDYYNGKFMGFAQATVSLPDGAAEVHKYYATEGYGLYDTTEVTCFSAFTCHNAPWWHLGNAAHGHEIEAFYYDTNGTTVLKHTTATYTATCPPSGVSATPNYVDGTTTLTWDGKRVSQLDHNNPVAVCDIQESQSVNEMKNGTSNGVQATSANTYDSYGRVTQETTTTNSGSPNQIIHKMSYIWNDGLSVPAAARSNTPQTISGTYIIDPVAFSDTEDSSGNRYSCAYIGYDGLAYTTGQNSSLTRGLSTTTDAYTNCGTSPSFTPTGQLRTTATYDTYGNNVSSDDADANAGVSGHKGCTISAVQHSDCTTFDSTFAAHVISSGNALNQTSSTAYTNTATGGWGTWPMSATDFNSKTTSYSYDALGRMTGQVMPGEMSGSTKTWAYANWCSGTAAQAPCIELDEIQRINGTTLITNRAFYDGWGRLVETRKAGPDGTQDVVAYAYYDVAGHAIFESNSYYVTAYTGSPGAAAFVAYDTAQVGTTTAYDGLERAKNVTDPLSFAINTTYTVLCGVAGFSDTGCYEQTFVVDANSHQRSTLVDGFGRETYDQRYTGNT
nr:hypothetical protein [Ktedonobacterales bacterium]